MKMKKLLAAALAATMMLSSMVTSFVASAEETPAIPVDVTIAEIAVGAETYTANFDITFDPAVAGPHLLFDVDATGTLTNIAVENDDLKIYTDEGGTNLSDGMFLVEPKGTDEAISAVNLTATFALDPAAVDGTVIEVGVVVSDSADWDENTLVFAAGSDTYTVKAPHECIGTIESKENEKAATCTEPGSYDKVVKCECGEEVSRETIIVDALGHTYVDGACSVCGEAEPVTGPQLDENILIRDPDVNIAATLEIRLRIDKRTLPAGTASYEMVVIPTKYDVVNSGNYYNEYQAEEIVLPLDASSTTNYAVYYYKDAAMYELGLNIDAYVKCYDADGNYTYYSNTKSYVPSVGLTTLCNATTTVEATKKVVTDMLNMGAKAQIYIASLAIAEDSDAYNSVQNGELVNAGLTTQDYAGTFTSLPEATDPVWNPESSINATTNKVLPQFALGVAPTPAILVYKASTLKENFRLEVSYVSNKDGEVSYTVTGENWGTAGTRLRHDVALAYYDSNAEITMKLYYNDVEACTTTYSVEAGLNSLLNDSNADLVEFAKATAVFGATIRARVLGS